MQQTENLNLNIIESTDTFSVAPLNENVEKLEDAIGWGYSPDNKPYVIGIYKGVVSSSYTVKVGFRPSALIICRMFSSGAFTEAATYGSCFIFSEDCSGVITFNDTGFTVLSQNAFPSLNSSSRLYVYIALR